MLAIIINSTYETLLMILISTFSGILFGIPLGTFLYVTSRKLLCPNILWNRITNLIVNTIRSIPYVIMIIAMLPITKAIVGTSIGTMAASIPLSIASITLITKITEESMNNVSNDLIEMGTSMGATSYDIIKKIILPESLPSLVAGITLIIITLIGFSAMAGTVGGGGLGDLAIRYGYQRYNLVLLIEVTLILILLINIIQFGGNYISKKLRKE